MKFKNLAGWEKLLVILAVIWLTLNIVRSAMETTLQAYYNFVDISSHDIPVPFHGDNIAPPI